MQQGYYLRDIVTDAEMEGIRRADFFCGEIGIIESLLETKILERKALIPMVSAHLGAKTEKLKKEELDYITGELKLERVLYFFDGARIRNNEFDDLAEEIENIKTGYRFGEIVLYLPYLDLTAEERPKILSYLGGLDCSVMILLDGAAMDSPQETMREMVREVTNHVAAEQLIVLFANKENLETCIDIGKAGGIKRSAVLI